MYEIITHLLFYDFANFADVDASGLYAHFAFSTVSFALTPCNTK